MSLLSRIADAYPDHAESGSLEGFETNRSSIKFYKRFELVIARNPVPGSSQERGYVDDGEEIIFLDGSVNAILRANQKDGLQLSQESVPAYLRFFFAHVGGAQLRVVESSDDATWAEEVMEDDTARETVELARSMIRPIQVSALPGRKYSAVLTGVFRNILVESTLEVQLQGEIIQKSQRLLLENLPVKFG